MTKIKRVYHGENEKATGVYCVYPDCMKKIAADTMPNHFKRFHMQESKEWTKVNRKKYAVKADDMVRLHAHGIAEPARTKDPLATKRPCQRGLTLPRR